MTLSGSEGVTNGDLCCSGPSQEHEPLQVQPVDKKLEVTDVVVKRRCFRQASCGGTLASMVDQYELEVIRIGPELSFQHAPAPLQAEVAEHRRDANQGQALAGDGVGNVVLVARCNELNGY